VRLPVLQKQLLPTVELMPSCLYKFFTIIEYVKGNTNLQDGQPEKLVGEEDQRN